MPPPGLRLPDLNLLEIEPLDTGDARLKLRDGTLVSCSRTYRDTLRGRLGQ